MLSSLIDNIRQIEKPEIPRKPASFKADEGLWGLGSTPPKPDVPGPSHNDGMASKIAASKGEVLENEPCGQRKTTLHREQVLETTHEILARVHALHLQTMHELEHSWSSL